MSNAKASEQSFALAFLDIDDFKKINDTYGHNAGDIVLVEIVSLIREIAGEETVLARYGGDEFVLLFPHTEREQAFLSLERIRSVVEQKQSYGEGENMFETRLTVSAGIAAYPIDGRSENELVRKADQATYRSKALGRNNIRLAYEEKMVPKTTHYTQTQLERLSKLAQEQGSVEAELLREALDDLLIKYGVSDIES